MNRTDSTFDNWPPISFAEWRSTAAALHLYLQVAGKYRLARSPWINHSWHATLYVTARGLTTSLVPDGDCGIEVEFDFVDHAVHGRSGTGRTASVMLQPMTVAHFHRKFVEMIDELGGNSRFHHSPNELPDAMRFDKDMLQRPYDADAVARFHRVLVSVNHVLQYFRTGYRGKVSPVHVFWGSFDLAVTRFSGRSAPLHPGGIVNLPDAVTREAYSHEVSSAGFWAGGGPVDEAAFYAYTYPQPKNFEDAAIRPDAARYNAEFGEFILPYDVVRRAAAPDVMLLEFLESTYEAAAVLGKWDRSQECPRGLLGSPPKVGL